ncbi:rhomboid family protein [Salibacterium aidingense]|uniref:rhomboid family protein n=1 Tax=Salibacterium aidingense TaxID=384933 RepID=UPI00041C0929|nr:rhomboid family intramembrane serine protease [Salibacterium aidingense]
MLEPLHRYWKLIHHLVIKENARILDISPDKKQIWMEMEKQGRKAAVRIAKIEYDWMNQLEKDVEQAKDSFRRVKKMILGRNLQFYNIYVSSYPPVDLRTPLGEHLQQENRIHLYFLSRDPSGEIADSAETILRDVGAETKWNPLMDGTDEEHENEARHYRKEVQHKQQALEKQDRSLLMFSRPRAIYPILAAIFLIFLWLEQNGESTNIVTLIEYGAKYNPAILDGEWWRLVTSMFLHIGFFHLIMNSLALFYIGGAVERMYGMFRFIIIYFTAGLFGSLASFAFNEQVSAGASGAIFGCFGALLYFGIIHRKLFFRTMGLNVLVILGINLAFGFAVPAVDNGAHIGGLAGGFLASSLVHLPGHGAKITQFPAIVLIPVLASGLYWAGQINEDKTDASMINVQLAQEYIQRDNIEEARRILHKMLDSVDNPSAYFVLGNTYLEENQYRQAAGNYEKAVSLNPELAQAHYNLSIAYLNLEKWEKAKQAIEEAKALNIEEQDENVDVEQIESEIADRKG